MTFQLMCVCMCFITDSIVPIDFVEVQTPMYQRVYQYLEKLDSGSREELETFSYMGILNDDYSDLDCIHVILRYYCYN